MKIASHSFLLSALLFLGVFAAGASDEQTAASVKSYLLKGLEKINAASQDFVANRFSHVMSELRAERLQHLVITTQLLGARSVHFTY